MARSAVVHVIVIYADLVPVSRVVTVDTTGVEMRIWHFISMTCEAVGQFIVTNAHKLPASGDVTVRTLPRVML